MNQYIKYGKRKFKDKVTEINELKEKLKKVGCRSEDDLISEIEFLEDKIIQLEKRIADLSSSARYTIRDSTAYNITWDTQTLPWDTATTVINNG